MNALPAHIDTRLPYYDVACDALAKACTTDEVQELLDEAERMHLYARQAKNKKAELDAGEIRSRAIRKLGQLMEQQRKTVGLATGREGKRKSLGSAPDPSDKPTLAEAGIDKHLAHAARKYAAVPEAKFEGLLAEKREAVEAANAKLATDLLGTKIRGTQGTGENEWYTPDEYIEAARAVLGEIDLDPASSTIAQRRVKAKRFFTEQDNGLEQEWKGRIWLNPPYAQPHIANFADKMIAEVASKNVTSAIMLTHNYTDTAWFQKLAQQSSAICFTSGRIRFISPDGELAAPTQGQAFFYFGPNPGAFFEVFRPIGIIARVAK